MPHNGACRSPKGLTLDAVCCMTLSFSFTSTMNYTARVRRDFSFVLIFGLFVPPALATDLASCQAGWELVSDTLRFSHSKYIHFQEWPDWCTPFSKAYNSNQQSPCELTTLLEVACQNTSAFNLLFHLHFSNSQSPALFTLPPLEQGENYPTPQKSDSAQECNCNIVVYRYLTRICTLISH